MKHKIFIISWSLMLAISIIGLVASPLIQSASIPLLVNHSNNTVYRFQGDANKPFLFQCEHNVSFILNNKPEGYGVKSSIKFYIKIRSFTASGVCRLNFTIYYNNQMVMCNIRDEVFEDGSEVSSAGWIVPPEWEAKIEGVSIKHEEWLNWRYYLKKGENKLTIKTIISTLNEEFNFGEGEIYVEIGPMKVEAQSLDIDKDGLKDPVDTLEINNYILLPILGIFYIPIGAVIECAAKRNRLKIH
ncbi:MAG: hypothetical protein QXU95_06040 [Candidatus Bathyarchaeia archaeon]|nr:hypothetical protein [Candidatus Bathyarchaeota archaeon]